MKIIIGDIFEIARKDNYDALCVTTNGIVKANGEAVMGAGIAKDAKLTYKGIDKRLGDKLKLYGNQVYQLGKDKYEDMFVSYDIAIISFPTKHDYRDKSDIKLIEKSAKELVALVDRKNYKKILVPQPGVLNGKLQWEDVKKVIEPIFDERFTIIKK